MKLSVKDLINAGMFSLLVAITLFIGGMIGFLPILMPLVPFVCSFVSAPVFMLYSAKIKKPGMVSVLAVVIILMFALSGHGIYIAMLGIVTGVIAEWILRKGDYRSAKCARLAYSVFTLCLGGNLIPIYFMRDAYRVQLIAKGYGAEYADAMFAVLPTWSFLPVTLLGGVGAFLGCTLGMKMLKKHFRKAGMVE